VAPHEAITEEFATTNNTTLTTTRGSDIKVFRVKKIILRILLIF
jgi:hypothetical protein